MTSFITVHSKKMLGCFNPKYGQTQPSGYIFNPMFEFVHI